MLDWLAILIAVAALCGAWAARDRETSTAALRQLGTWTLTSVALAITAVVLIAAVTTPGPAHRPLLAGLGGGTLAWLLMRRLAVPVPLQSLLPMIGLLAAAGAWLVLTHASTPMGMAAGGTLIATTCTLGVVAGAAYASRRAGNGLQDQPRLPLVLAVLLLALSALGTLG